MNMTTRERDKSKFLLLLTTRCTSHDNNNILPLYHSQCIYDLLLLVKLYPGIGTDGMTVRVLQYKTQTPRVPIFHVLEGVLGNLQLIEVSCYLWGRMGDEEGYFGINH